MTAARCDAADGGTAGFSLVDILVGLVLLSVIAGLMAGFIGQFRILKRVQSETSAQVEVDALMGFLRKTISGAMRLHLIDENPERRFFLEGDRDGIRFNGLTPQGLNAHRLREISIALKGIQEERELVQTVTARRYNPEIRQETRNTELLANGIVRLEFRYLPQEAEAQWQESWRDIVDLPRAVEISLTARRGGRDFTMTTRALLPLSANSAGSR